MTVLSDLVDLVLTLGEEKELPAVRGLYKPCLLYTSDAADE